MGDRRAAGLSTEMLGRGAGSRGSTFSLRRDADHVQDGEAGVHPAVTDGEALPLTRATHTTTSSTPSSPSPRRTSSRLPSHALQSVAQLQDLDAYMHFYNRERAHQGYRTKGRTPYQAFLPRYVHFNQLVATTNLDSPL